jgi:hypothetical protein
LSSSSEFLKMSKQSPLESFDTELFINEIVQLQDIWDSFPEEDLAVRIDPFLVLYTAEDEPSTGDDVSFYKCSPPRPRPLHLLTEGGGGGGQQQRNSCFGFQQRCPQLVEKVPNSQSLLLVRKSLVTPVGTPS